MDVLEPLETQELKKTLCNHLMGQRYLIFLVDVWNKKMWDEVKECFPDKSNKSRIVITSRITEVARYATPKEPHSLRFLDPEESWLLFCKKVFRGDPCPPHLEPIGRQISYRCKGLPLSIVVLGSMLAAKEKSERVWEGTINFVSSFISEDKTCHQVLALSYHHLPLKLKPCFLYFGAFPEDYEISVRRLIALWLADGLVQPIGNRPLEDVAENYLEELINWSLVQIGKRRSDGGIKTCRVHDMLRDLCIEEAIRENFLTAGMESLTSISPSFSQRRQRRVSSLRHTPRLISSKAWDSSPVRAILSFDPQRNTLLPAPWRNMCSKSKLLRILDLGDISAGSVPQTVSELVNLRYLRLCISSSVIPSSICGLWNLKMLFIHGSPTYVFPVEIFKLQQLEQLIVRGHTFPPNPVRSSTRPLLSLRVMSFIFFNEAFESLVTNLYFPNLIKLALNGSLSNMHSFLNLVSYVPCLETLTLKNQTSDALWWNDSLYIFEGVNEAHILASNLRKLTLNCSYWTVGSIELLGKSPCLQILKLQDVCLCSVSFSENTFPKLHRLYLENVRDLEEISSILRLPCSSCDIFS